ncbi:DUF3833 domain-containing protein [Ningiella sp. W23]|uniref:DUF3833 domain-containing protein n=1 Tax=Ningiella sp. W23 TaxID=3023715 RepID=UPI0037578682
MLNELWFNKLRMSALLNFTLRNRFYKSVRKYAKSIVAVVLGGSLFGCSVSIDGETYQSHSPEFELEQFFDGEVKAWGIVQNRSGEVVQRFIVDINAYKDGNNLILDETFEYGLGDGPKTRVWTLTPNADGTYTGNAGDIAGPATGVSHGNAFNFTYEMDLEVDGSTYRVYFDDWFWAFDQDTMMNRSYIKKFGIVMAEVTIFMQKQG